jgi:hypothetical protein
MARNKKAGDHPSYKKRGMTSEQIKKKKEYDTKYHKSPEARKYRSELNQERRKRGIYGKGGGDLAHSADGKSLRVQSASKNRANNRPKVRQTRSKK